MRRFSLIFVLLFITCMIASMTQAQRPDVQLWPYPREYSDYVSRTPESTKRPALCLSRGTESLIFSDIKINSEIKSDVERKNYMTLKQALERTRTQIFAELDTHHAITLAPGRTHSLYTTADKQEQTYIPVEDRLFANKNGQAVPVTVEIDSLSADLQIEEMDESYSISVQPSKPNDETSYSISIKAKQLWGGLRALETLTQLVEYNVFGNSKGDCGYFVRNVPININDAPRFPWRGLSLDIARHFVPVDVIKRIIDGLAALKLNTLKLHMVDSESFNIYVDEFPQLQQKGVFAQHLTYTDDDYRAIVAYARERGVRVIPEMEMPGHFYSLSLAFPEIISSCPVEKQSNLNSFPLDPTNEFAYTVIDAVLKNMRQVFPDNHFHLGADELVLDCWRQDPRIQSFLKQHPEIKDVQALWGWFQKRIEPIYRKYNIKPTFWEEVLLNLNAPEQYVVPKDEAIIQVWRVMSGLNETVSRGYKALMSSAFYLDKQHPVDGSKERWLYLDTWEDMYTLSEPQRYGGITEEQEKQFVLGGEAALWGEQVDYWSIDARLFPRMSAAAERLWSSSNINNVSASRKRIIYHRCYHLARRGIKASPIRPDYCPYSYPLAQSEAASFDTKTVTMLIITISALTFTTIGLFLTSLCSVLACVKYRRQALIAKLDRDQQRTPLVQGL